MKNISKYLAFAILGLATASCGDDYNDWANPQTNPQEDAITIPGFTASATSAINFANVSEDSVNTFSLSTAALPEGFALADARIELTPQDVAGAKTTTLNADLEGKAASSELSDLVVSSYGKRPTARTFDAHVYVDAVKDGQAVLIDAGKINVIATPKAPFIDKAYYLVGNMTDWQLNNNFKFTHTDADVYEDPVFTLMFTTTADNQCWKIIPQGNVDAGNIWAVENAPKGVVGVETDGDDAMSGNLLTTTSEGKKANAGKIAKAGMYQMTINMMDYTYTIKEISPEYYLVGDLQGWKSDQDKMVCLMTAETPMIQSYTTKWTGGHNLKIWLGSDFSDWNNAYGSAKLADDDAATGSLKAVNNAGAIVCPEKDAYYTFTADFSTMTYKWTKLENQNPKEFEKVGLIGVNNDWDHDIDLEQVAPHNWYKANVEIPAGNIKFRADHKWGDGNWGYGDGDFESKGTLVNGSNNNIKIPAGKYNVFFNDITCAYAFVEVK